MRVSYLTAHLDDLDLDWLRLNAQKTHDARAAALDSIAVGAGRLVGGHCPGETCGGPRQDTRADRKGQPPIAQRAAPAPALGFVACTVDRSQSSRSA